ncbi:MAG: 50S ribosomal protein L3 [Gammaproteobacteria bacterium RIFCSPLOWO2_02_FULL_42_14]|nr:MAG: 50S ribosomal protein L3 [Gammaproteobacteria bacterium RIFCSPHIGHO2_02_FULL_42_43]OGT28753.1 MAG: 50S ribosomal protein L3 [Gammaproteobacteria bacterium RIFCSPHIGHO2_01_FULL_42_8]OGT52184.1 MAG: 50S ribosomal protein L3 [Gammaproteobacteria bacterium RIFCSPHIGHO2_12_FULL_41_25]OGT62622.1 MAG: 50S ribosomal protein L3 [Gammaproteobacteria bacterium RIFCSPLOWO2_02_FULL_42_14]OGT86604.1 MAG: 50S ribosomal protein L3 [Gammaproteobacteria bacterium RIFCSPLOWO2_12_FULL_42_18]
MTLGLVGQKRGMTRVFTEAGESIPVTVIEVMPNRITQIKTNDPDGYTALQVTMGSKKSSRVNKAQAGHFAKASVEAGLLLREFRVDSSALENKKVGDLLTVEMFQPGQFVDVQGTAKGKGFSGVIKRHHFTMQDATHGNSLSHRAPGSTGQRQTPGRVFKGKKMAGHLGDVKRSAINQEVIQVNKELNCILVKGAIPGAISGFVMLYPTVKHKKGTRK